MRRFTGAAVMIAALSVSVSAQWPRREPPGVPKGADGGVNLAAPAPRAPDGRPDLGGIWEVSPRREAPGSAPPGRPPLAVFANIGVNFPEGLPFQPWAAELSRKRVANQRFDNPDALWGHESEQLEVLATRDAEKKSIKVEKIVEVRQK